MIGSGLLERGTKRITFKDQSFTPMISALCGSSHDVMVNVCRETDVRAPFRKAGDL